ncbi:hypothetical protein N5J43_09885 [Pseudomonas nicosulfuronedens]|uniref:DUF1090 family protein n=1 Tax=Pseudomonas nicosulfuronedens TaxID=2571105 RepID=A0A5R9QX86_9PSED|nr:hypothetical protein [Pseudomonas nicosulfuronedens]MDH1008304.1 hypothetical protein [Pseudomonas nicosulfuronedens]MDH1979262.1 hypothetical protein [Pseudomonas nicosulfuronedens]MDH2027290.1 hypothetical protein [Pseudomonas nicosulfuronedens]TLX74788.1 hypothetical protein FAS41_17810 [Pseudomonas nicosulfuronedens]
MKRAALLITAALLTSPAFAADLCSDNLQKVDDAVKTVTNNTQAQEQAMRLQEKAAQAQAAGDTKACIAQTEKALQLLKKNAGDGGANG